MRKGEIFTCIIYLGNRQIVSGAISVEIFDRKFVKIMYLVVSVFLYAELRIPPQQPNPGIREVYTHRGATVHVVLY